jgi:hypothetical protein
MPACSQEPFKVAICRFTVSESDQQIDPSPLQKTWIMALNHIIESWDS